MLLLWFIYPHVTQDDIANCIDDSNDCNEKTLGALFYLALVLITVGQCGYVNYQEGQDEDEKKRIKPQEEAANTLLQEEERDGDQQTNAVDQEQKISQDGKRKNDWFLQYIKKAWKKLLVGLKKWWDKIIGGIIALFLLPHIPDSSRQQFLMPACMLGGSCVLFIVGKLYFYPFDGPRKSPLLPIFRVFQAALKKRHYDVHATNEYYGDEHEDQNIESQDEEYDDDGDDDGDDANQNIETQNDDAEDGNHPRSGGDDDDDKEENQNTESQDDKSIRIINGESTDDDANQNIETQNDDADDGNHPKSGGDDDDDDKEENQKSKSHDDRSIRIIIGESTDLPHDNQQFGSHNKDSASDVDNENYQNLELHCGIGDQDDSNRQEDNSSVDDHDDHNPDSESGSDNDVPDDTDDCDHHNLQIYVPINSITRTDDREHHKLKNSELLKSNERAGDRDHQNPEPQIHLTDKLKYPSSLLVPHFMSVCIISSYHLNHCQILK